MHFDFPVSSVLKNEINKVTVNDIFFHRGRSVGRNNQLAEILDQIGKQSTIAQGLPQQITSTDKLKEDQIVYLVIDSTANNGTGELIGMLKIGMKSLFLHDKKEDIHQKKCQCVLDFYVDDTKQRMGYGKRLFDYMLEDQRIPAYKLPIDRPSPKLLQFLKKHYQLDHPLSQNNNYVVYADFFDRDLVDSQKSNRVQPSALTTHTGRFSGRPQSTMAMIVHNSMN